MRFLCEQCKAKYQIADEKVAGKTVRMKCRKCGHLIEVKAEVTETSVASKAPQAPAGADDGDDATRVGMDVNAMMKLGTGAPTAPRPAAPRPSAGTPAAPQAPKPTLATTLASAKPARPSGRPESALAGAFQKSVQKEDDLALLEISTSSEWYVAINGVPVGPVRVTELRRKAHSGAVTEESLVWQEGMEEWRPLKTVPELLAIVQDGMNADRPSLVSPEPPRHAPPRRTPSVHPAPAKPATPAPPRSNVVSLASRLATAEKLEPEPIVAQVRDPFAVPPSSSERPAVAIDPFAPAPTMGASAPLSPFAPPNVSSVVTEVPAAKRAGGPNWIILGMVVAFGAFGVTAGIAVFFNKPAPAPAPTIVVTAAVPPSPVGPSTAPPTATNPTAAPLASNEHQPAVPNGVGGSRNTNPNPASTSTGKPVDPSIAALLGGPGTGPSVGGGSAGGGGGSALSQEAIERVVQQRSAGVKRTCWERGGGTEANVNVRVHLTIAASGGVQNASAEGNDPIVSKCIENSVRGWSFPPSSGPTTVDIPFHFLRQ